MQYSFRNSSHNEGSLKIYEPKVHEISHNIFNADYQYPYSNPNPNPNPNPKSYNRQQSLIDQLQNREQPTSHNQDISSNNNIYPKPTSIEFLVEQNDNRLNRFNNKIQDIFANKPALSSKEINSSMFLKSINDPLFQANAANNPTSQIIIPSFPSKEYISDSPERPNLSRPFLRKKTTSKSSQGGSNEAFSPTNQKDEQTTFEVNKIQVGIKSLRQHNQDLANVYKSLKALKEERNEQWRYLKRGQLQILKLMIEKAIIGKEEYH